MVVKNGTGTGQGPQSKVGDIRTHMTPRSQTSGKNPGRGRSSGRGGREGRGRGGGRGRVHQGERPSVSNTGEQYASPSTGTATEKESGQQGGYHVSPRRKASKRNKDDASLTSVSSVKQNSKIQQRTTTYRTKLLNLRMTIDTLL